MLRLSKLSDYGTVIMAHMALAPNRLFSAAEVAAAVGIPLPTASKVLKALARETLLVSQRGAHGGYALARRAQDISIAQIVSAMEGPIGMTECSVTSGLCTQEPACAVRGKWLRINRLVLQALEDVTLAEFARPTEIAVAMPPPLVARRAGTCGPDL